MLYVLRHTKSFFAMQTFDLTDSLTPGTAPYTVRNAEFVEVLSV